MQLLWLLPGVGFGLILGISTGQWMMASFALLTFGLLTIGLLVRQNQQPFRDSDEIHWGSRRVAIGNRKLARQSWLWKPEIRQRLITEALSQNQQRVALLKSKQRINQGLTVAKDCSGLAFFSGFSSSGELVLDLVQQGPHAFISGPTGSGKSQYLKLILTSLTETYSQAELQLVTLDFKGGATLNEFDAVCRTTDLENNHAEVFSFISNLLVDREKQLHDLQFSRIEQVSDLPRVVIAVDELAALLQIRGALEVLEAVSSRGRSLGIHLVATAQSTSGISRSLLVNLGLRIATGKVDPLELAQLGFKPVPKNPLKLPGMIFAQLQGANLSCDFSFPIVESSTTSAFNLPQAKQIHLLT